jgi:hypothetical protein
MPSSGWSRLTRLDIDDVSSSRADDDIGRAGSRRVGQRPRRRIEALRIQHLPAAHVKRFLVRIAAIIARGEAVFDQADAAFVDAHFSARDSGLGEAHEARLRIAPCA